MNLSSIVDPRGLTEISIDSPMFGGHLATYGVRLKYTSRDTHVYLTGWKSVLQYLHIYIYIYIYICVCVLFYIILYGHIHIYIYIYIYKL